MMLKFTSDPLTSPTNLLIASFAISILDLPLIMPAILPEESTIKKIFFRAGDGGVPLNSPVRMLTGAHSVLSKLLSANTLWYSWLHVAASTTGSASLWSIAETATYPTPITARDPTTIKILFLFIAKNLLILLYLLPKVTTFQFA